MKNKDWEDDFTDEQGDLELEEISIEDNDSNDLNKEDSSEEATEKAEETSTDDNTYEEDEADEVFDEQEKKRNHSNLIRRVILVIAAVVFIYAAYNLVHIFLEYKKGDDIYNAIEDNVLDQDTQKAVIVDADGNEQEVEAPFVYNHDSLLSINADGIGYLYIPAVDTRLPMVQGTDNDYYLEHAFDGSYTKNGCLFEDYRITGGLSANQVIIYGHNLKTGGMFGSLFKYQSQDFWASGQNSLFYIYTENKIMEYKIFSVYTTDPISDTYTFNFGTLDAMRSYANRMKAQSDYDTGVNLDNASQIVTFSTCTNDSKRRFIVHGVYVGEASLPQ